MKAEDLMVGDLVKFPHGIDKVCDLPYVEGKGICASFAASATLFPVPVEALEPIPLTPEILEKNGFKKAESDTLSQTWAWAEKREKIYGRWVQITFYNKPINGVSYLTKIETCSQKGDGVDYIHSCDIESVHELQHALRLCGINLEIKL